MNIKTLGHIIFIIILVIAGIIIITGLFIMGAQKSEMTIEKEKCEAYSKEECFYYMCMNDATRNFKTSNEIAKHNLDVCLRDGKYNE